MSLVKKNDRSYSTLPSIWDNFLNRDVFNWGNNFTNADNSMPAVNIKETPEKFLVEMAAPRMEKKDFKIELDGNALTISSEKHNEREEKTANFITERNLAINHFTAPSIYQKKW